MEELFRRLTSFFRELKRRKVYRVAVTYALVAFVALQAAELLFPFTRLPPWLDDVLVIFAFFGFFVALVLAWAFEVTPEGVRRTPPADADRDRKREAARGPGGAETRPPSEARPESARPTGRWLAIGAGIVAGLVLAVTVGVTSGLLDGSGEMERAEVLQEVRRLADEGRYGEAFALATDSDETLGSDSAAVALWSRISDRLTVTTEPPGARVLARTAHGRQAEADSFRLVGTTPLDSVRIPRVPHLLRIEREGFAPARRIASSGLVREAGTGGRSPEIVVDVQLVPTEEAPEEMVFVPGGTYRLVSPVLPRGLEASLDPYFIDRHEVTNSRFQEFVQEGGYQRRGLWPSPLVSEADTLEHQELMERLVDQTNLHAPRGWSGQEYPEGEGDHPVTGVTWYEAVAYCAFRDKILPTIFQWEKAARDGKTARGTGILMPWGLVQPGDLEADPANFASSGTEPVGARSSGISPYGAYAMGGNVKEWTANPIGERGRAATGGSWADPMYVFSEIGAFDPMFASASLGFRCARVRADDARRLRNQGAFTIEIDERTPTYEPVDEETYRSLLAHYRYDRRPLEPSVLDTTETPSWTRLTLTYAGPADDRVLAYLWLPKSTAPPHQTIVYVASAATFSGRTVADEVERFFGPLVRSGRAIFAPVLKGMVEREWDPGYEYPESQSVRFRELMVRHATEIRLGLDYLETRDEVDMDRLAYLGLSFGAGSRLVFAGVDDRYDAVVFVGGGIDERVKPTLPAADNVNFAPYIEPPKFLLNGRQDEEHPWYTRGLPLWNLLREPKELVLVEGAGHLPPPEDRIPAINSFLDETLGPAGSR